MKRWAYIGCTLLLLIAFSCTTLYAMGRRRRKGMQLTFWHSMSIYQGDALERLVTEYNDSQDNMYVDLVFQGLFDFGCKFQQ